MMNFNTSMRSCNNKSRETGFVYVKIFTVTIANTTAHYRLPPTSDCDSYHNLEHYRLAPTHDRFESKGPHRRDTQ